MPIPVHHLLTLYFFIYDQFEVFFEDFKHFIPHLVLCIGCRNWTVRHTHCCFHVMLSGSLLKSCLSCVWHMTNMASPLCIVPTVRTSANTWRSLAATLRQGSFPTPHFPVEKKHEVALRSWLFTSLAITTRRQHSYEEASCCGIQVRCFSPSW